MNVQSIEIEDPIEMSSQRGIEVVIVLKSGERRWCYFLTPEAIIKCGDWIKGTKVRFHYGSPHLIVVSEISEGIIEAAIQDIDEQGLAETCSLSCD